MSNKKEMKEKENNVIAKEEWEETTRELIKTLNAKRMWDDLFFNEPILVAGPKMDGTPVVVCNMENMKVKDAIAILKGVNESNLKAFRVTEDMWLPWSKTLTTNDVNLWLVNHAEELGYGVAE